LEKFTKNTNQFNPLMGAGKRAKLVKASLFVFSVGQSIFRATLLIG